MAKKEMNALKGGMACRCECHCVVTCPCKYAGPQEGPNDSFYGGSSANDNAQANVGAVAKNDKTDFYRNNHVFFGGY